MKTPARWGRQAGAKTTALPPRRGRAAGPWGAAVLPIAPMPEDHAAMQHAMVRRKQGKALA